MLLSTECYHQFHIPCFKQYLKQRLIEPKPDCRPENLSFMDPECLRCKKIVGQEDISEILGKADLEEIENKQMEIRVKMSPNLFKCVECKSVIMFEPSKPDYKQKDEQGKVISAAAAEHSARHRCRCAQCSTNFCTKCEMKPYHMGVTCEEAENYAQARKCRFCQEEIKKNYNHPKKAFQDCCGKPDCVVEIENSCEKMHVCGHACKGWRGET